MTLAPGRKKTEKLDRLAELSAVRDDERGVSLWREAMRRLRRNPAAIIGAVILAVFVLVAVVGPFLVPHSPTDTMGIREGVVKSGQGLIPGPSGDHWFGYDHQGRDEFSRMIVGARQTLIVGIISTLIGLTIGVLIGGVAGAAAGLGGRWGRQIDNVLMRIVDMMLSLPGLLLAVSVAALLGPSLVTVMIAVGVPDQRQHGSERQRPGRHAAPLRPGADRDPRLGARRRTLRDAWPRDGRLAPCRRRRGAQRRRPRPVGGGGHRLRAVPPAEVTDGS
jgi:hypothetical protein